MFAYSQGAWAHDLMIATYILFGAVSLLLCLWARPIGRRLGLLDMPDGRRKTHARPTPLVGGIAVMAPVGAMCVVLAVTTTLAPLYATLGATAGAFLLVGLIDDRGQIRPLYRLLLSTILFLGAVLAVPALSVDFLLFSFYPHLIAPGAWLMLGFSLLCLVGVQNATNMADGKDGLAIGLSLLWTSLLFANAPDHLRPLLIVLAVGLAVALIFNLSGHLFLGDSGSYSVSAFVGFVTIYCYGIGFPVLRADAVAVWFLIPVVDCLRLMAVRLARGHSPFSSDQNHLHHILARWMPWRWGLPLYLSLVGVPSLLAHWLPSLTLAWALAALLTYGVLLGRAGQSLGQRAPST